MQVSELTALREAREGARGCYKVLGWAREDERKEPSEGKTGNALKAATLMRLYLKASKGHEAGCGLVQALWVRAFTCTPQSCPELHKQQLGLGMRMTQ